MTRVTHKQRILDLLRDGKPHTHHELYALGCVAHSRVSDLRADGYQIEQWNEGRTWIYRLCSLDASANASADFPSAADRVRAEASSELVNDGLVGPDGTTAMHVEGQLALSLGVAA